MLVRLGYVAMSTRLEHASPSQTMTYKRFASIADRDAAIGELERIAKSNLINCLRLLKHNAAHDIEFFRLSSRLIPLANHEDLRGWDFIIPIKEELNDIREFLGEPPKFRIDFHPDHFVVINSHKTEVFKTSLKTLLLHQHLLEGMGIPIENRCVLHIGGVYQDKEKALEQFIHNWGLVPEPIQRMIMLENDDTSYHVGDVLYLCEKLGVALVFGLHHHLANYQIKEWGHYWERIVRTWEHADLSPKIHISSPRSEKEFKAHADFVEPALLLEFLKDIRGTVDQLDCMIEAKQKDGALFKLVEDLRKEPELEWVSNASFII